MATATVDLEKQQAASQSLVDPVEFCHYWLNSSTWPKQDEILRSIATNSKTAVRSCHSSGKTYVAALATCWWLARYKKSIVITTAPTSNQVEKQLWKEIADVCSRARYPFPKPTQVKLDLGITETPINAKRYAFGFTTTVEKQDEGVKFQGFHGAHVLIIFDEAPGVEEKIFTAAEGIRASGHVSFLLIGNPTIPSGIFFDAFGRNKASYNTLSIDAFETPNFDDVYLEYRDKKNKLVRLGTGTKDLLKLSQAELLDVPNENLTSRVWVKERFLEWGPFHPLWASRVRGDFPVHSEFSLLSMEWVEAACNRAIPKVKKGRIRIGIDVAGPGEDETVACVLEDDHILELNAWPYSDPRGEIMLMLKKYPKDKIEYVNVDSVGIGYYLARHIEDDGYPVNDVNVQTTALEPDKYYDLKSELFWQVRDWFEKDRPSGEMDETTKGQLLAVRYKPTARGLIKIESKEEMWKRGVKSPDRAEAIMLAVGRVGGHGLIDVWREQAENMKKAPPSETKEVVSTAESLATAQKKETGWMDRFSKGQSEQKEVKSSPICPCGNKYVSSVGDNWKCNVCGSMGAL